MRERTSFQETNLEFFPRISNRIEDLRKTCCEFILFVRKTVLLQFLSISGVFFPIFLSFFCFCLFFLFLLFFCLFCFFYSPFFLCLFCFYPLFLFSILLYFLLSSFIYFSISFIVVFLRWQNI